MSNQSYIRIVLGSPDTDTLPDAIIEFFLNRNVNIYLENKHVLYFTCLDILQYLINRAGMSGEIFTSQMERVGEIVVQTSGNESQKDVWQSMLNRFISNPEYIDPDLTGSMANLIIIGGVRKDRFFDVKNSSNGLDIVNEQKLNNNIINYEA